MKKEELDILEKEGYSFISEELKSKGNKREKYITIKHNLCGKEYTVRRTKFFNEGQRCSCQRKIRNSLIKNIKEYEEFLEKKGFFYEIISDFISIKKPITVKCKKCGRITEFKRAENPILCKGCSFNAKEKDLSFYQDRLSKQGIEILNFNRNDVLNFLEVKFPCGHIGRITRTLFYEKFNKRKNSNFFCPICGKFAKEITLERVRFEIESVPEYRLISDKYEGTHIPIEVEHTKCSHRYFVSRTNFLNGQRCPKCAAYISESQGEKEIREFIESLGYKTSKITANKKGDFELDIFIDSCNLGVEYNGLRWHSNKFREDPEYHLKKSKYFFEKSIMVIHIFEDEWKYERKSIEKMIKNALCGKFKSNFVYQNPLLLEGKITEPEIYYIHGKKRLTERLTEDDEIIYGCGIKNE